MEQKMEEKERCFDLGKFFIPKPICIVRKLLRMRFAEAAKECIEAGETSKVKIVVCLEKEEE